MTSNDDQDKQLPDDVSISIIICTYNRATSLKQTLNAFEHVRIPAGWKVELIVVDNASTDETAAVTRNAIISKMDKRYLYEPKKGQSNARNAGLASARGEFIFFTDDDVVPAEDWVEQMVSALVTEKCDAVIGQFTPAENLMRPWFTLMHKWWLGDSRSAQACDGVPELIGGNMGFRRSVLQRVGGFDPELGPGALGFADDTLFGWQVSQAGFRIAFAPKAVAIHHFDPSRLRRCDWHDAARKRGRSTGYLRYHWHHDDMKFPRLKWLLYLTKLRLRRLLQPPPALESEGCPLWEMSYLLHMEMSRQFCLERQRPRNYSRRGLTKRVDRSLFQSIP